MKYLIVGNKTLKQSSLAEFTPGNSFISERSSSLIREDDCWVFKDAHQGTLYVYKTDCVPFTKISMRFYGKVI